MESFDINKADVEKLNELWQQYEPQIRRLCEYMLRGHPEFVDDVVSETFYQLCKSVSNNISISNHYAWLLSVSNNLIKQKYSELSNKKTKLIDVDAMKSNLKYEIDFNSIAIEDSVIDSIYNSILEELTPNERELLSMRYDKKMKIKDIALQLGTTEFGVKQRTYKLTQKIKTLTSDKLKESGMY